jgi:anaerobic selenocysteine-containing dehydrogenase
VPARSGSAGAGHPDRIQTLLKLSGPRALDAISRSRKEAQQLLVTELQQAPSAPQAIALLTGRRNRGTMGTIIERFAAGLGTPNVVSYDPFDPAPLRKAMELMTGLSRLPAVDFANARYLLSFNANLFETFLSPVRYIYSYGQFRQGRPGIRGKFVQAEPRLSQTAACADEWLPIRPGTEGLPHCDGARQRKGMTRTPSLRPPAGSTPGRAGNYAPEAVASEIDVPAASIQRVAREFAQMRPSVAVGDSRDVASLTAIYALNALVGAFGMPGGILPGTDDSSGPVPAAGAADILGLIGQMSGGRVKALLILESNPLFTLPEAEELQSALASVPFVASFASFLDETSVMADVILPSHVTLERWVDDVPEPGPGFSVRTVGQPVVEPRWDTRDPGDVLIETAKALGGRVAEALPFENMAAAVKESFRSVHALQAGSTADADFDAFYKKVLAAGGWWNPPAAERAPSKVTFIVPEQPVAARVCRRSRADGVHAPYLPSTAFADGRTAHLPWLQELPDPMTTVMWGSWVEINPETAHKLDVHEGDVL